ncbi:MAG: hypothetical protein GXY47_05935 [Acidobacteria bacterium]|nr:hypothetical protein [Acidobacteriota bacterium]
MKHSRKTDIGAELLRHLSEKQVPGTVYSYRPADLLYYADSGGRKTGMSARFGAGLRNFRETYQRLVNSWIWIDNAGAEPIIIEAGDN